MNHSDIKKITTSSIICALSLAILITGIIPGIFFVSIFVAICISIYLLDTYGVRYWVLWYIVVSTLALILSPDLELTLTFICMAWYPIAKYHIDKSRHKVIRIILKVVTYTLASYIIYKISIAVFGGLEEDIPFFIVFYIAIFILDFYLLDFSINLTRNRIIPRIHSIQNKD